MSFFGTTFGEDNCTPEQKLRDEAERYAATAKGILEQALKVLEESRRIDVEVGKVLNSAAAVNDDDAQLGRLTRAFLALMTEQMNATAAAQSEVAVETERRMDEVGPNDLLNPSAVAELLGLSPNTLAAWRCYGKGPAYVKLGTRVLYRREDVEAFVKMGRREATGRDD